MAYIYFKTILKKRLASIILEKNENLVFSSTTQFNLFEGELTCCWVEHWNATCLTKIELATTVK